jgi:hypothetical protein
MTGIEGYGAEPTNPLRQKREEEEFHFGHAKPSEGQRATNIPETHHSATKVDHPMLGKPQRKTLQGTARYRPVLAVPKDGSKPNQHQADRATPPSESAIQGETTSSEQPIKREPLP